MLAPELLDHLKGIVQQVGAHTVYGEPVVAGNTTVVPVASVAFGFGGGSGKDHRADSAGSSRTGGGGGGGFHGQPAGYIEITTAGTRFVPVHENRKVGMALLVGIGIGFIAGRMRSRL